MGARPRASPRVAQSGPGARGSAAPHRFDAPNTPPLQAKTKGLQSGVDIGVKYSEKQERNFDDATMKAGQCVIGLQVGSRCLRPWPAPVGWGLLM